ncbi:hypothetical protein J6590_061904 [Homalodisca vitripennis]|nr:hypothetical protein J6590_061904 [Homalodisca vitripennis]
MTFLGLTLDDKLKFHNHIENLSNKVRSGIFAICTLIKSSNSDVLLSYYGLVYPHLAYALHMGVFTLQPDELSLITAHPVKGKLNEYRAEEKTVGNESAVSKEEEISDDDSLLEVEVKEKATEVIYIDSLDSGETSPDTDRVTCEGMERGRKRKQMLRVRQDRISSLKERLEAVRDVEEIALPAVT